MFRKYEIALTVNEHHLHHRQALNLQAYNLKLFCTVLLVLARTTYNINLDQPTAVLAFG